MFDVLFDAGSLYELFCQGILFPIIDQRSHGISAEDIQEHIKAKGGPFEESLELPDLSGPRSVRRCDQDFGLLMEITLVPAPAICVDIVPCINPGS